jgi:5-methylcytosine-specific restriction endonuclease McrA
MRPATGRGSAFRDRRDPAYMAHLQVMIELGTRCDGCGERLARTRAHGIPRSLGGPDRENVALLCHPCDQASEKRWAAWGAEHEVDLFERARMRDRQYEEERLAPLPF